MRCLNCGLVYLSPRPADNRLKTAYEEKGYDPFLSLREKPSLFEKIYAAARKRTLCWKKQLVEKLVQPDSHVLDMGCGTGEFLCELKDKYIVEGYEPEPSAVSWVRERFGLDVHTGNFTSVDFTHAPFNLISLWHVLEHIPDPSRALDDIAALLSPGGIALIALPNPDAFDAKIYRSHWVAYDAPRHLWHFGRTPLTKLALKSGLKLIRVGMMPLDTFYNSLLSEQMLINFKGRTQLLLIPFRMTSAILLSLGWGFLTGQHSGNYYIFQKEK